MEQTPVHEVVRTLLGHIVRYNPILGRRFRIHFKTTDGLDYILTSQADSETIKNAIGLSAKVRIIGNFIHTWEST